MRTILVVEDDRLLREGLKALLASEGYSVRSARNGVEALTVFRENAVDLVLMDVMMPRMDGFTACRELRRQSEMVPVVFLTANDTEESEVRSFRIGADDFISKAASNEVLLSRIRRALSRVDSIERVSKESAELIKLGNVTINTRTFEVVENGKKISELTRAEADMLIALDASRGSYIKLDNVNENSALRTRIYRLRTKLGAAGELIISDKRFGYMLLP